MITITNKKYIEKSINYWENYYKKNFKPSTESLFAKFVLNNYLKTNKTILDLGCGNGRDSIFFSNNGLYTTAIDISKSEINYLQKTYDNSKLSFICKDFFKIYDVTDKFDYVYSRFSLHSVKCKTENIVLGWIKTHLSKNGLIFIEVRSIKDIKYNEGIKISNKENFADNHYRRYFSKNSFIKKLIKYSLKVIYINEGRGLAPYKNEDPIVLRIVAKKI